MLASARCTYRPLAALSGARHSTFAGRLLAPSPRRTMSIFKGKPTAAALKVGDNLADFPDYFRALPSTSGSQVALSNFKGSKAVVVFFYPKDDTPGCVKEACSFRDSYQSFTDIGCEVVGVSSDSITSHDNFKAKHGLPYTLLSDDKAFLRNGFGVPSDLFGMLPGRQTYVISIDGKCLLVFNSQMDAMRHVTEALEVLKKTAGKS